MRGLEKFRNQKINKLRFSLFMEKIKKLPFSFSGHFIGHFVVEVPLKSWNCNEGFRINTSGFFKVCKVSSSMDLLTGFRLTVETMF